MSVDNDKRELLKLKQGLIEESEAIDEGGYDVAMPDTAMGKFKNWLWHNKIVIIIGFIIIAVISVVCWYFFVHEKPDIVIYSAGNYNITLRQYIEGNSEKHCPDYDKNGRVMIRIKQPGNDAVMGFADLYAEVDNGNASIYIGTKEKLATLYKDYKKAKDIEIFADLKDITGSEGYLIDMSQTSFGEEYKLLTTEIFIAVKNTDKDSEKQAMEFVSNLYNGNTYLRD